MIAISVILPTYNRLSQLKQVLDGFAVQTFPQDAFELVVVSDGSTDGTDAYLQMVEVPFHLRPIFQKNQGAAAARNAGVAAAVGELILFIDDDVVPDPNLIQEHICLHHAHGDKLVVLGPMLTPADYELMPWVLWEQEMLYKQYDDMAQGRWQPTARQFYTGNTSLARKHLLKAGGFDTQFRRAEDVELAYRLMAFDLEFVFAPQAVGHHYANRSFRSWLATPYAYGRNDVIFTQNKGQSWLLPTVYKEFYTRHQFLQQLVRTLLDKPTASKWVVGSLNQSAKLGTLFKLSRVARLAYSCIFNLSYYQGVADELGGRSHFLAGVDNAPR